MIFRSLRTFVQKILLRKKSINYLKVSEEKRRENLKKARIKTVIIFEF